MRMTISSISRKFNRVPNLETETLDKWMRTKEEGKDIVIWVCLFLDMKFKRKPRENHQPVASH